MHAQMMGEIGPFLDTVQQRQVSVVVLASCKYASAGASGGQAQMEQQIQSQMLRAIHETIAPKMAAGQLSFKDLGTGNTGSLIPEIFARSGLAQAGIAVDKLIMHFGIDGRAPAPLPVPQDRHAPPAPENVNMRIDGFNVHAGPGGIDTGDLKDQLVAKAKSTILWYLGFGAAVVLVLAAVGGYGYYAYLHTPHAAVPAAAAAAKPAHPAGKK